VHYAKIAQRSATADAGAARMVLDWSAPIRHQTFYKSMFQPAVARTNRLCGDDPVLPPGLKFHALPHTYASLCVAVGVPVREVAKFMGHTNTTTTEHIYTHLFDTDDHADAMAALDALDQPPLAGNVIRLRRG
jgi:integrase